MIENNENALSNASAMDPNEDAQAAQSTAGAEQQPNATEATATETPNTAAHTPLSEDDEKDAEAAERELKEKIYKMDAAELLAYLDAEVTAERVPELSFMNRLRNLVEKNSGPVPAEESNAQDNEEETEASASEEADSDTKPEEVQSDDELQIAYINLRTRYQQLRNDIKEKEKKEREENLRLKEELLVQLEETLNSTGDFFKIRNERNNIVAKWREIGPVPENNRTSVLDRYAKLNDQFYHQNKLEKEAMEEDYRHNRREKEGFIKRAKELGEEPDVEKAFRELQSLHDRWKEIGPVAPEFRDAMWAEFKEASTVVNRKFDQYHQELHRQYDENFEQKKALIERLENMLIELPQTREGWRKYESDMDEIRTAWKGIGRVPKEKTREMNLRYRQAVDEFYIQRRTFMKELSAEITPKLEKMRELVKEADSLKESTDYRHTTDRMLAIQKEWKEVSNLGANVGEANRLWRQLRSAMDTFFGNKREAGKNSQALRTENLEKKRDVAARLKALWDEKPEDFDAQLADLQKEWDSIGPMPDAHKDEVMNLYYGTLREIRGGGRREGGRDRGSERRGPASGNTGRGRAGDRRDRPGETAPKAAPAIDLKKDVSSLDTKALQDERKAVKKAISDQRDELLKLENSLGFFRDASNNPMFAHLNGQMEAINERIRKYEERLDEIKVAIKSSSSADQTPEEPSEESAPDQETTTEKED